MANGTGQGTRGQFKQDQGHGDVPWRPRKIPCATNRSEEIERHSHGPHLAAMCSSLGGACRETAPALVTASSGMRSPCLPSLLTVRVARQTNHYGCELGWGGGILVRALLPGGDCRRVPSPHRGWGPSASVLLCPRTRRNFQLLANPNLLLGRYGRGVAMATAMTMDACGRGRCVGLSVTG